MNSSYDKCGSSRVIVAFVSSKKNIKRRRIALQCIVRNLLIFIINVRRLVFELNFWSNSKSSVKVWWSLTIYKLEKILARFGPFSVLFTPKLFENSVTWGRKNGILVRLIYLFRNSPSYICAPLITKPSKSGVQAPSKNSTLFTEVLDKKACRFPKTQTSVEITSAVYNVTNRASSFDFKVAGPSKMILLCEQCLISIVFIWWW